MAPAPQVSMRGLLLILPLLLACGAGPSGDTGDGSAAGGGSDGGSTDPTAPDGGSDDPPEVIPPSGDRILVYTGHGGLEPASTGQGSYLEAEARWEALGYNTHTRDELPEDLSIYRLILLVAPGAGAAVPFSADEVARLEAARAVGSRLVIMGDLAMCASAEVGQLLSDLGVELAFTGDGADSNQIIIADDLDTDAQPLAGVSELYMRDPCHVTGGSVLARDSQGNGLLARQWPADGGDVLVLGDLEVFDDNSIDDRDNALFADNLALVVP